MEKAAFRPHHIFCKRFLNVDFPERGLPYQQVSSRIRRVMEAGDEFLIEAREGIDELCLVCPNCHDGRCQSAQGDEAAVRKWDSIILSGLEVPYGETRTSTGWRMLIEQKAPLKFCQTRCPYRERCGVLDIGLARVGKSFGKHEELKEV